LDGFSERAFIDQNDKFTEGIVRSEGRLAPCCFPRTIEFMGLFNSIIADLQGPDTKELCGQTEIQGGKIERILSAAEFTVSAFRSSYLILDEQGLRLVTFCARQLFLPFALR
jgi:hypothetical protein